MIYYLANKCNLELNAELTKEDAHEPWTVYASFPVLLQYVRDKCIYITNVSELLGPNFCTRLFYYLDLVQALVPDHKKMIIKALRLAVLEIDTRQPTDTWGHLTVAENSIELNKMYLTWNNLLGNPGEPSGVTFSEFLGLCLFLSIASKGTIANALQNRDESGSIR